MDDRSQGIGNGPNFAEATDPLALFRAWMAEAEAAESVDPEAMALATVDAAGLPDVRMILLKGTDERGFVFYTNCESAKGRELAANPRAALLFYWKSLGRQIRLRGPVEPATEAEAATCEAVRGSLPEVLAVGEGHRFLNLSGDDGRLVSGEFWDGGQAWYASRWIDPFDVSRGGP